MKILTALVLVCATLLPATTASAAVAAPVSSSLVSAKDDKPEKSKPKPKKTKKPKKPGSSRGGNPPSNSNGKGRAEAPGQVKKGAGSNGAANGNGNGNGNAGQGNGSPRSENENKKITFCHVPPGNPDNGHAITTSVNAITPGHTNHSGDIIPPFSFTKQGKLVSFPGQNWGPGAQAIIDNGCKTPDASSTDPSAGPTPTEGVVESVNEELPAKAVASTTDKTSRTSFVDGLLPNTGGGRLAVLLVGLALLAGGALLMVRRRSALSD